METKKKHIDPKSIKSAKFRWPLLFIAPITAFKIYFTERAMCKISRRMIELDKEIEENKRLITIMKSTEI